ncbi:MAG: flavodoxin family protein, partial [Bacteroidales bacterium]
KVMETIFRENNIHFEITHIGNKVIQGCMDCGQCAEKCNEQCVISKDMVNEVIQKLKEADGIVVASPVYYSGIAGTLKNLLDRVFFVGGVNDGMFKHKIGAALVTVRRSGGSSTLDGLNHYFSISQIPIASADYWNIIHGRKEGELYEDKEGIQIIKTLAHNMIWLLKMREATANTIPKPETVAKIWTNFVR